VTVPLTPALVPLSPEWWLARLYGQLEARRAKIELYTAYYQGDHPLPWLAPQARDEFRRILRMTRTNYMGLVVDAQVERCKVEGFRLATGARGADDQDVDALDEDTWRIWQANDMDAGSDSVLLESAICGTAYLMMAPNPADPSTPFIYPEHPSQAIVEYTPGTGRRDRAAGLKVYVDDWTGQLCATLQTPTYVARYAAKMTSSGRPEWRRREVRGEIWGGPNEAGEVTLVEVPNNPRMLTGGVSEIADVTDIQDRINKTIADRLITQDYGAFPQKWIKAWPTEDAAGNPVAPLDIGRNRVVTTEVAEAAFGQWDAAPLDPYSAAKREDVKDVASRTRTPAQYLLGEMNNVSGDTLQASQSGLVAKCQSRMRPYGEGFEAATRVFRKLAGLPDAGAQGMETIWHNPEFRTLGELTDAIIKKLAAKVIDVRQAREDAGYSATQIDRMEDRERQGAIDEVDLRNRSMLTAISDFNAPGNPDPAAA
jgi:hypothetical protein